MHRRGFWALGLAGLLLAACATRVPLDHQAAAHVQRLGTVTPALPDGPMSRIRHSPGLHLGLAGGVADALLELERNRQFTAALAARGFDVRTRWDQILTAALKREGFTVVPVPVERPDARFLERYPEAPVDAFLDVSVRSYGHMATTIATPFLPFAHVRVRLSAPDGRVLMAEEFQVAAGSPRGLGDVVFVAAPATHGFDRSADVPANPDKVVAGLEEAMTIIADAVARSLRPTPAAAPRS